MEFWGIEVKAGKPLKVTPELGKLIHISQASLGEVKDAKAAKSVPLRLKVDDKSFVFGYLSVEGTTQIMVDLVFEREFELSHDLKNGSVYFLGYTADEPPSDDDEEFFSDESEDDLVEVKENGNVKPKSADVKAAKSILAAAGKANNKVEAKKEGPSDSDSDDEDTNESDSDDEMALDGLPQADSDDSDDDSLDDEDDSSDEEELPKVQQSKKRPVEIEQKGPASKKAKSVTPEKSGKKGKTETPTPSKSAGNKSKEQTPKSAAAQVSCKSCSKTFTSGTALQSHNKAKHESK